MSKIRTKELIICIISIAVLMLALVTDVFAADNSQDGWNNILGDKNNVPLITEQYGNNTNNSVNNNVNNTVNNAVNNKVNNTTSIPNTGVDYSVVFIIAVCGISAIYAYKKIRNYNNF